MTVIDTKRLLLRCFDLGDCTAMDRVFSNSEVMRFGPGVQDSAWVRMWLRGCLDSYQHHRFGLWAVVEKGGISAIGYCGLTHFTDVGGRPEVEIGYRLARPFWGRGYGTEAAIAVRDHAFDALGLPRLIAMIDPRNVASIRVAEKIGMLYEKDVMLPGFSHPDHVYSTARRAL